MFVSFASRRFVSTPPLRLTAPRAVHDDPVFSPDGDRRDWGRREADTGKQRLALVVIPPQMPRRAIPPSRPGDPRRGDPFREPSPDDEPTPLFPGEPRPEPPPLAPWRRHYFPTQAQKRRWAPSPFVPVAKTARFSVSI